MAKLLSDVHVSQLVPSPLSLFLRQVCCDHVAKDFNAKLLDSIDDRSIILSVQPFFFDWDEDLIDQVFHTLGNGTGLWFAEIFDFFQPQ